MYQLRKAFMREPLHRNFLLVILSGFAFFVAEFFIKNWIIATNADLRLNGFLSIKFVPNTEMAFSLPINGTILVFLSLMILLGMIQYFTICSRDGLYGHVWALNFVIWGAFSNMYDRLTRGFVVDYIQIGGSLPVFNLADLAIAAGLFSLLYLIIQADKKNIYQLKEV